MENANPGISGKGSRLSNPLIITLIVLLTVLFWFLALFTPTARHNSKKSNRSASSISR